MQFLGTSGGIYDKLQVVILLQYCKFRLQVQLLENYTTNRNLRAFNLNFCPNFTLEAWGTMGLRLFIPLASISLYYFEHKVKCVLTDCMQ